MQAKSWIVVGAILLAGSLAYSFLLPDSTESIEQLERLQKRERQKEQQHDALVVRPAIPEFPDIFDWETTRVWNLPLNNPAIVSRGEAHFLGPEDYVCGVLVGEHARAYPWFVLANYHAINDHIDGKPVIVNLCEACNGGSAFLAYAADTTLDFRPCGIKNGTWYAVDFQTGSYWYPFVGKAFKGPLEGTKLERLRLYFSTWRDWVRDHPDTTVVVSSDEVRNRSHGILGHMGNDVTFNPDLMKRLAKPVPNPKLELLAEYELVFGLIPTGDAPPQAYVIDELAKADSPIQTQIGSKPVVLFVQNQYQVGAYVRKLDERELELELKSDDPILMSDQLGNSWNAWGRTVSGPNHPAELSVADGYLTKWYEWLENFPDTDLIESP